MHTSGETRREIAKSIHVIASAAKQSIVTSCGRMDCFASLAMTRKGRSVLDPRLRWDDSGGRRRTFHNKNGGNYPAVVRSINPE